MIEYKSENGYTGRMYGKQSFSIYASDGHEVMHSGFRSFNDLETLKEITDQMPEFLEMLNGIYEDCEECEDDI